jgi:hypothetical protein
MVTKSTLGDDMKYKVLLNDSNKAQLLKVPGYAANDIVNIPTAYIAKY